MTRQVYSPACWLPVFVLLWTSSLLADPASERSEVVRRLRSAQQAVVGTVVDVQPRLERNRHGDVLIVSQVAVDVTEHVLGQAPSRVLFDAEGGTLNGYTMRVSDMPELRPGHRAVFLLRADERGRPKLSDRGASILSLTAKDAIAGSHLSLQDVRQLARQVAQ
jgi:hypothetical protein